MMLQLEIIEWYLQSPALIGAVFPFLVSAIILIAKARELRHVTRRGLVTFLILFAALLLDIMSGYWTHGGYHIPPISMLTAVALFYARRLPLALVYPAVFFTCLAPDVLSVGVEYDWMVGWWDMVGGYGFHDGLFLFPLCAVVVSSLLLYIKIRRQRAKIVPAC